MIKITTINDSSFKLEAFGKTQIKPKGYENFVSGDDLQVASQFYNDDILIPYISFTQYEVDGVTFANVIDLQIALSAVVFRTASGSGANDLENRITVNQTNFATTIGGVIDSTKEYFLDGVIDLGNTQITIPTTGISIKGYTFDLSGLISTEDNYTMFISESAIIGSGNVLGSDYFIETSGVNSKVYNLYDATGFNAFEFQRINYNNCTSLGDIYDYRQGLEGGTGRFGGSPSLTLHGTWLGGFRITTSIVRGMSDTTTEPLFKAGTLFVMNSRFLTDINLDLGTLQPFIDFSTSNFTNPSTLQLKGCIITRNGLSDSNDTNILPNITNSSLASDFDNNQGIKNTFIGGKLQVSTQATTTISSIGDYVDVAGTFTAKNLQHFDVPSSGRLRHLGKDPIEFQIFADFNIESNANLVIGVRVTKFDDSTGLFQDFNAQLRQVNSLVGGRDVAFFTILANITLEQNDYVKFQIANLTNTNNLTLENNSFYKISEQ